MIVIGQTRTYYERQANSVALFNEAIYLFIAYTLQYLSHGKYYDLIGWVTIALTWIFLGVNFSIEIWHNLRNVRDRVK